MVKRIVLGIGVIAMGAVVAIARRPSEYQVSRMTTIHASPAAVFARVEDLRRFNAWNPWLKLHPDVTVTYGGPDRGPGATMQWAGNRNVGEGRMTIVDTQPHEVVQLRLEFFKPFASTASAEFTFHPAGAGTAVMWSMTGHHTAMGKAMSLMMDMDRMIGGQFEKGLADLKSLTEATAKEMGR